MWHLQKMLSLVKTTPSSSTTTAAWYGVWPGMLIMRKVVLPTCRRISSLKVMTGAFGR